MKLSNTYDALTKYAESRGLDLQAKPMRKLLTTLRLYVLEWFKISLGFAEPEIKAALEGLSVTKFAKDARQYFEVSFAKALQAGKNSATLQNDRSNLVSFLIWIELQQGSAAAKQVNSVSTDRAPKTRTGASLGLTRKGKGKNTRARQYALPELTIKAEYPQLDEALTQLEAFWRLPSPPAGYTRLERPIAARTFHNHRVNIRLFLGYLLGMQVKLKQQRLSTQRQKVVDALAIKVDCQNLQQQRQQLEQQLEALPAQLLQATPLEQRRQEVIAELSALQVQPYKGTKKSLLEQKRTLEQLLRQLDTLALDLMLDPRLLDRFIAWGTSSGNGKGWATLFYGTAIAVAKWRHSYQNPEVDYSEVPIIRSLKKAVNTCSESYETNIRQGKSEKWLDPAMMVAILNHLKTCTAKYNHQGEQRSPQAILCSWQKYLLVLILFHYPLRVSEICRMALETNLEWKLNEATGLESYYCKYSRKETKTKVAKEWFFEPEVFNQPLREWLEVIRPTADVNHNFIFFMVRGEARGLQYTEAALARLFQNTIYTTCRDLRAAAQDELKALISQGKSEQEARQALAENHRLFIDLEPRRTNIHYTRHLASTQIRQAELPYSVIQAFHKIIGNSPEIGEEVYNQMELHEETAPAIDWRRDAIASGKVKDEATLNAKMDRFVGALLMLLTTKQKRKLLEQGFDLMDLK